jgi:hypothetical protein
MKSEWVIKRFDGDTCTDEWTAPSGCNIKKLLERLYARELCPSEIINSTRRSNDKWFYNWFEIKNRTRPTDPIEIGDGPVYTAQKRGCK